jgi:alpha-2-macroglobulin
MNGRVRARVRSRARVRWTSESVLACGQHHWPPRELESAWPTVHVNVNVPVHVLSTFVHEPRASNVLRIEPQLAGRAEWRDPITLRFVPAAPLVAGAEYQVTVSNNFLALDGSRLEAPLRFAVKARSPSALAGDPVGEYTAVFVGMRPTFKILLTDPTDAAQFASLSSIAMAGACGGARIGMRLLGMRLVSEQDPLHLQYQGMRDYRFRGDTLRDRRRVIELQPNADLPRACRGQLYVPFRERYPADSSAWTFRTYGPLTVSASACNPPNACAGSGIHLEFSTPVRGTEVLRRLRTTPLLSLAVHDTAAELPTWLLKGRLDPNRSYTVVLDSLLTDVFGQQLRREFRQTLTTGSYAPAAAYPAGVMLLERNGPRVLPVQAVNVDTLIVRSIAVPVSAEAFFLSGSLEDRFHALDSLVVESLQQLTHTRDVPITAGVPLAANDGPTLRALQILRRRPEIQPPRIGFRRRPATTALVQVTNLAVHARVGIDEGLVWVTGVNDARPRAGALVELRDRSGHVRAAARTDSDGLARLANFRPSADTSVCQDYCYGSEGYVSAHLKGDRAVVGINSDYSTPIAPWNFQIPVAWSAGERTPVAAALFTERGIYRPGEEVYAKAIVRRGPLGALRPARADSLRWEFLDSEGKVLTTTATQASTFGTSAQSFVLSPAAQSGGYQVRISSREDNRWRTIATAQYRVAEYRAPEFLVEMNVDTAPRIAGDSLIASIAARYLFGAAMSRAKVTLEHSAPWRAALGTGRARHRRLAGRRISELRRIQQLHASADYLRGRGYTRRARCGPVASIIASLPDRPSGAHLHLCHGDRCQSADGDSGTAADRPSSLVLHRCTVAG